MDLVLAIDNLRVVPDPMDAADPTLTMRHA